MNKKWSTKAWESVSPFYKQILELNFIQGLIDGALCETKFSYYVQQDSIYLGEYGRVLAGIGAKLMNATQRSLFLKFASDTVFVEQELHRGFKKTLKSKEELDASPACLLYTSFLHKQLAMEPIELAVAAVLPCFVVYKKVGDYILKNQSANNNPYQQWIDTYGGEDFANAVNQAEQLANDLAQNTTDEIREKMEEVYTTATKMEWMFWNSAYELEKWPL